MKYLIFVFTLIIISFTSISAQNISPYSRFGIGDMLYSYSARSLGMGHSGSAILNQDYINIINPASLAGLNATRIEFSYSLNFNLLSTNSDSRNYREGVFKGFAFAFPISRDYGIGASLGLIPYSRLNYHVQQTVQGSEGVTTDYILNLKGEGGLSKIFIGTSYKLPFDLFLGASFDYYFGNLEYSSRINFPDNTQNPAEYKLIYSPRGIGTTIGLISPDLSGLVNSESISNFRLGAAMNLFPELDTDSILTTQSNTFVDTVATGTTQMKIPYRFSFGTSLIFNKEYTVSIDYTFQPWSEFEFTRINEQNLKNAHKISTGFEFRPSHKLGADYLEQIIWRFGLSYEQTHYKIMDNNLQQYSVSGGFSLPIGSFNWADFGIEYAVRGTKDSDLISENFIKFNLGFSFGDIWFTRYEK